MKTILSRLSERVRHGRVALKLLALCGALIVLPGCLCCADDDCDYDGGGDNHKSRGPLSGAMSSLSTDEVQPPPVANGGSEDPVAEPPVVEPPRVPSTTSGGTADSGVRSTAPVHYHSQPHEGSILFDTTYLRPLNGDIDSINLYSLEGMGMLDDANAIGLYVSGGVVNFKDGTLPKLGTKDSWQFEFGAAYRHYFNGSHAAISPYFAASVGVQAIRWEYRTPVIDDGDTIRTDALQGVNGYAGLGLAVARSRNVNLFAEAGFGGTTFVGETVEGFQNDVFHDYGYFAVKAGLSVNF